MDWFLSRLPTELPGSWDATHGWTTSWLLPLLSIVVIAGVVTFERAGAAERWSQHVRERWRRGSLVTLAVAALLAGVTYADYGVFRYGTYLNEWDVYHYYLGSKYAAEVRYKDLYAASLVADEASGLRYDNPKGELRDLETLGFIPVDDVLSNRQHYRDLFSAERWREFVADVEWFKQEIPPDRWSIQFTDHGYNGTPIWTTVIGAAVTNRLSIRGDLQRGIMLALDPVLLLVLICGAAWAFDLRVALLLAIFIGTHYFLSWGHLKGAIVRTDYGVGVGLAVCLMRKGFHRFAGVCLGWAILSRVFPVVFLLGPMARLGWIGLSERRLDRPLFAFLVACAATGVGFISLSLVLHGTNLWFEWFEKITTHYQSVVHWNIGYQTIYDAEHVDGEPVLVDWSHRFSEEPDMFLGHKIGFWFTAALVAIPTLVLSSRLKDHEALCMGFVVLFFTVQATYYYMLVLVAPLLFFAGNLTQPSRALGAMWMYCTGMAGYLLFSGWEAMRDVSMVFNGWHQTFGTTYYMAWLVLLTSLHMVAIAAAEAQGAGPRADTAAPPSS